VARAVVLWLPGGGWHTLASSDLSYFENAGLRVVEGRYRLSDVATWPAQLDDVRAAARAAQEQARADGLPLLVAGDSAGAHLALHVGLRGRPGDVAAVVAVEPPVDPLAPDWPPPRVEGSQWHRLLGHLPAPGDPATRDVSVAPHAGNGVPVLLVHGNADESVPASQSLHLAVALLAAGHPVTLLVADGTHGGLDFRRADLAAVLDRFLTQVLSAASAPAAPGR
jgi:acetyl esterase/lipase